MFIACRDKGTACFFWGFLGFFFYVFWVLQQLYCKIHFSNNSNTNDLQLKTLEMPLVCVSKICATYCSSRPQRNNLKNTIWMLRIRGILYIVYDCLKVMFKASHTIKITSWMYEGTQMHADTIMDNDSFSEFVLSHTI